MNAAANLLEKARGRKEQTHGQGFVKGNYRRHPSRVEGVLQMVGRRIRLQVTHYAPVTIPDITALHANLRAQLGIQNNITLSDTEFARVLNHLDKGNVFERAKTLRGRMHLAQDDGTSAYIQLLNCDEWCRNQYQVTTQVTVEGHHKTRYDITLLVNGLPLVQIELKRRGLELKEAFNQINRYQRHSYWADAGLFQYVQLFVISNGVNTKYYANNRDQDFKQTFYWASEDNTLITQIDAFADAFLEKCHMSKMVAKYIVLHESDKVLMALRPQLGPKDSRCIDGEAETGC
ncbi:MAG: toxin-antitoxin system, toxin component [Pseudorhodobacter sp. PARRP1]|nr:MAG: toxin-antitoxin system, toxin component [Pseudorhodobacter sp. PARRP1]